MERCPRCSFNPTSESDFCDEHRPSKRHENMARRFHEAYERLAPQFGYETRSDTRKWHPDTPNGKLMIAVMRELFP